MSRPTNTPDQASRKPPSKYRSRTSWQPGQSGNPSGRPREVGHVKELARQYTEEAIRTLAELMRTGKPDRTRVAAAEALLDRAWGRPAQAITGEDGGALEIRFVTQVPRPGGGTPAPGEGEGS